MIILFLISALFATVAVTITFGLAVLVVYLWRQWVFALRSIQMLEHAYKAQREAFSDLMFAQPGTVVRDEQPLLFVNKSSAIH